MKRRQLDQGALSRIVAGDRRCMFGNVGKFCGYPASVHVLRDDGTTTMDCKTHIAWWRHHPHQDAHPISPACGLPDTRWERSTPDTPGRCTIEGLSHIPDLFAGDNGVSS